MGVPTGMSSTLGCGLPSVILVDTSCLRITRAAGSGEASPGPESVRARKGYSPGRTDERPGGSEERQPQLETRPLR